MRRGDQAACTRNPVIPWSTPILFAADLNDNPWDGRALLNSTPEIALATRPPRLPLGNGGAQSRPISDSAHASTTPPGSCSPHQRGAARKHRYGSDWYALDQFLVSPGMLQNTALGLRPVRSVPRPTNGTSKTVPSSPRAGDGTPIPFKAENTNGPLRPLPARRATRSLRSERERLRVLTHMRGTGSGREAIPPRDRHRDGPSRGLARARVRCGRGDEETPALGVAGIGLESRAEEMPHAQSAYRKARSSGSRPIEAVGTAVAAFIGLAPGGPVNSA